MDNNIQRSLGRIEGKLDGIVQQQEEIVKCNHANREDIVKLKQQQSFSKGQASAWGVIGGLVVTVIATLIKQIK